MSLRNHGIPPKTWKCPYVASIERARHVLSVAKQHVPNLVINGTRVDMEKWRVLVRANIADLASRHQPLDEEIMRNYFPELVDQAVCIHRSWRAAMRDYHENRLVVAKRSADPKETAITPATKKGGEHKDLDMESKRKRVNDDILLLDSMKQDLSLAAMLRTNRKLVQDGIDVWRSWRKAVAAAGLDYTSYGLYAQWTDEEFLLKGKGLIKAKRFDLVQIFYKDVEFAQAIYDRFGSWDEYKSAVDNYVSEPTPEEPDEAPESGQGSET